MRKKNKTRAGRFTDSSGRIIIPGLIVGAIAVAGFVFAPADTFAAGTCTVTFKSNINHFTNTQSFECGGTPSIPTIPGATGYSFSGNFTSASGLMSQAQVASTAVNHDVTYTAQMVGNKYNVTIRHTGDVPSGVRNSVDQYTYERGGIYSLPNTSAWRAKGYNVSWSSHAPISNQSYIVKVPYNFTVTANWKYNGSTPAVQRGESGGGTTITSNNDGSNAESQTNNGTPLSSVDNPTGTSSASAKSSGSSNSVNSPKTGVGEFAVMDQEESPVAKIVGFAAVTLAVGAAIFLKRSKMRL